MMNFFRVLFTLLLLPAHLIAQETPAKADDEKVENEYEECTKICLMMIMMAK